MRPLSGQGPNAVGKSASDEGALSRSNRFTSSLTLARRSEPSKKEEQGKKEEEEEEEEEKEEEKEEKEKEKEKRKRRGN